MKLTIDGHPVDISQLLTYKGLMLAGVLTGWAAFASCIVMGVGVAGVGFCIGHDGQHGSFSERPRPR